MAAQRVLKTCFSMAPQKNREKRETQNMQNKTIKKELEKKH